MADRVRVGTRVRHPEWGDGTVVNWWAARPDLAWLQEDTILVAWDKAPPGMRKDAHCPVSAVEQLEG